jgi:uncharacterized oligopeptide transporter (OPT) family protein
MAELTRKKRSKSHFSEDEFYLEGHDEEKVLMFATGLVLGVGIASTILGIFIYGGIALVAIALSLIYMEHRQHVRERHRR